MNELKELVAGLDRIDKIADRTIIALQGNRALITKVKQIPVKEIVTSTYEMASDSFEMQCQHDGETHEETTVHMYMDFNGVNQDEKDLEVCSDCGHIFEQENPDEYDRSDESWDS